MCIRDRTSTNLKSWIDGLRKKIDAQPHNNEDIIKLKDRLDEFDKRRNTNWRELWPWLDKYECK